jgi:hypothetical protein
MNHLGTDVVGKRKCRAALKDDKGKIVDEFFFSNERNGILSLLSRIQSHGKSTPWKLVSYAGLAPSTRKS